MIRFVYASLTNDNSIYFLFIVGAALNFLPQILGYTLIDPTLGTYPDFLQKLSDGAFTGSLIASLASTFPIVIDYVFDLINYISHKEWNIFTRKSINRSESTYKFIPFREIALLLILPDLLFLFWIIPNQQYDYMPGLIGVRDTMYVYSLLTYLVQFGNPIWTWPSTILIAASLMAANVLGTCSVLSVDPNFLAANTYILPFLVALGLFNLLVTLVRWFWYLWTVTPRNSSEKLRNDLCSAYAIFATIFILGDWLIFFAPQPIDPDWSNVGAKYLSLYTYLMAFCTVMVTVITTRNAREDSINTKVIMYNCTDDCIHRFL